MIIFAHTKFGLVWIQGSGVKRGAESAPPRSERVFQIPVQIGLIQIENNKYHTLAKNPIKIRLPFDLTGLFWVAHAHLKRD